MLLYYRSDRPKSPILLGSNYYLVDYKSITPPPPTTKKTWFTDFIQDLINGNTNEEPSQDQWCDC